MRREKRIQEMSAEQEYLVTRDDVLDVGGSDGLIKWKISTGSWRRTQVGVYQTDRRPTSWEGELMAAVLAGGPECLVSHRAALVLWGMDGLARAPVEITAPYTHGPLPKGTIVHRTRREMEPAEVRGIPVVTPARTLLQASGCLPSMVVVKALESALRLKLTSIDELIEVLAKKGGRGVKGTKKLRWAIAQRVNDTATYSGAETELLFHMRRAMLPQPVLQHELFSREGERMLPDFYWPHFGKAVEVDGLAAHASADRLDADLKRQNALLDMGVELRRFSAREVRRNPSGVVDEIQRFLES